jgi:hypothetical protein
MGYEGSETANIHKRAFPHLTHFIHLNLESPMSLHYLHLHFRIERLPAKPLEEG